MNPLHWLRKWRHQDLLGLTPEDYEVFSSLSFRARLGAVVGFALLGLALLDLLFLPLLFLGGQGRLLAAAGLMFLAAGLSGSQNLLRLLFPRLRMSKRAIAGGVFLLGLLGGILLTRIAQVPGLHTVAASVPTPHSRPVASLFWPSILGVVCLLAGMRRVMQATRLLHQERTRQEAELEIARQIQERIIPDLHIQWPGLEVAGRAQPAREVGGDFFQALELASGRVALLAGDVSGHGVGSGLLVAMIKGCILSELRHSEDLGGIFSALNQTVYDHTSRRMFVTLSGCILDPATGRGEMVGAGHPPLLHLRQGLGDVVEIPSRSMGLGLQRKAQFRSQDLALEPGDSLVFLTDGLIENGVERGQEFGLERAKEALRRFGGRPVEQLVDGVLGEALRFGGEARPEDDMTLMIATRSLEPGEMNS